MRKIVLALICVSLLVIAPGLAQSAELKIFASRAVWTVLQEIGPGFEKETGHKLTLITGLSPEFMKRIDAGEPFDMVAAPPPVLDGLVRSGKVVGASKINLVRSAVGVVVRAGARKPDVSSVEAFKQTLLAAKSITYLPVPGVPQLLERLGLKEALASKTTVPETEICMELVAKGEVELAVIVATQAFTAPGVELAGLLPQEIQTPSVFGAAISSDSQAKEAAQRLLDKFKTPRAVEVIRAQGMDPM